MVAIFADVLAPYGAMELHLADRLQGSSIRYLLGTDHLGRDLLSRLIFAARLSLVVGLAATTLNVGVAAGIGIVSGFLGGKVDLADQDLGDADAFMQQAPWLALWPGLCVTIVVNSFNMLGDALRDLLDPRLRGGGGRLAAGGATSV